MSVQFQPLQQVNQRAIEALVREIGVVDAIRFLSQFRVGSGDYTAGREQAFKGMSVKDIVREIREAAQKPPEIP